MEKDVKRQLLREKILAAAKSVFLEKGFAEAKVGDIAAAAGISSSTLYLHFSGKRALFDALDIPQAAKARPEFDQKQEELAKIALSVFGQQGFENATMDEMADRMGFSKATLYQYCSSKEELFLQALEYYVATGFRAASDVQGPLPSCREYFRRAAKGCFSRSGNAERNAFLSAVIQDSKKFPILGRVYFNNSYRPARESMVNFLRRHQALGHIRPDVDLVATADVYLGVIMSYVVLFRIVGGIESDVDEDRYIERAADIFANDLEVRGTPH